MIKNYSIFKNISLAFISNIIGLIASSVITFVLPKFIGVTQYSYYQLYIFYVSYVGFLGFGWVDGLYLRYGGKYFDKINQNILSAEFRFFSVFEFIISLIVLLYTFVTWPEINKFIIYCSIALCIIIYLPRAMLHNLLLASGQIQEYAFTFILENIVKILFVIIGILIGELSFFWFICSDLIGRFIASLYVYFVCRKFIFAKICKFSLIINEIAANIKCGIFLMLSNVASMLIIGVVRQFIEIAWNIETFGKISLTLALSNFILIFINSVSMVLFPIIKRCEKEDLVNIYNNIRTILMSLILFILVFYVPVKFLFSLWLPQYSDSLKYMAILFPLCAFECKMNLLINTYYKSERKEKFLLLINSVSLILSILLSILTCSVFKNLDLAVLSIIFLIAFRCILAEFILSKFIAIQVSKDILLELILVSLFIYLSWYISGIKSILIYLFLYIIYIFMKKSDILSVIRLMRKKC